MEFYGKIEPLGVKTAAAMGYFDGLHRGHASVIAKTVEEAKRFSLSPALLTFDFGQRRPGGKGEKDLLTPEHNQKLLAAMGIERLVRLDFASIMTMEPPEFVERVLGLGCLNSAVVCCGEDFRFGAGRRGDLAELTRLCLPHGIRAVALPDVDDDGVISTSRIKKLVQGGDMQTAARLLGRPYSFFAEVVKGAQYGRKMGFPTINQPFPQVVAPRFGVYASRIVLEGKVYPGVTNVGVRPTVQKLPDYLSAETHIIDYEGDLYGRVIEVELLRFMRDEQKFSGKRELYRAISQDVESSRQWF